MILCRIHFFEDIFVDVLDKYYRAKYYLVSFEAVAALIRMLPSQFVVSPLLVSDPCVYAQGHHLAFVPFSTLR